ncbi:MAG: D-alanine--D-alanine ligase [Verrucomicrobia bacterium]|nr:D-alanine--D-alanine ligase [Verrucomicrobiota bacterium]MBV8376614.1 D-alanine--D-alanine ligase [Verrucomicrobiota bacterium]
MNNFLFGKKIAVLCGGLSSEREVSLRSGSAVAKALQSLGAEAFEIDVLDGDFHLPAGTDLAFNALHGTFGEDGTVQAILEDKGIPYTGEGEEGSRLAFNKIESKRRFVECGLPTAPYVTVKKGEIPDLPLPYVVKVPCQGSSVGVYLVKAMEERARALQQAFAQAEMILVEAFISGRELTVGVLGDTVLPIIEIRPRGGFYSYENKYTWTNRGGAAEHECPARLSRLEKKRVESAALAAHRSLGLEIYSRVDLILDANREPQILEVNTIPGMTETSLLPEAAAAADISMAHLCEWIVRLSLERRLASER